MLHCPLSSVGSERTTDNREVASSSLAAGTKSRRHDREMLIWHEYGSVAQLVRAPDS
jgi:hypothetical protein